MDLENNVERVERLLTGICGCTDEESIRVLTACLDKYISKNKKSIRGRKSYSKMRVR